MTSQNSKILERGRRIVRPFHKSHADSNIRSHKREILNKIKNQNKNDKAKIKGGMTLKCRTTIYVSFFLRGGRPYIPRR